MARVLPLACLLVCVAGWSQAQPVLTEAEQQFLREHPEVTIGAGRSFPPFVILNGDGTVTGHDVDIAHQIERATGLKIRFVVDTWASVQDRAARNELDGLSTAQVTDARLTTYNASRVYFQGTRVIIVGRGNPKDITGLDDLVGKRVALQRGNRIFNDAVLTLVDDLRVEYVDTLYQVISAVATGEADFTVLDETAPYLARQIGLEDFVALAFPVGPPFELRFLVRKDWPALVSIIDKGLRHIPEATYQSLREHWFGHLVRGPDRRLLWRIFWGVLAAFVLLAYWVWVLRAGRKRAERLVAQLRLKDGALEQANLHLEVLAATDHLTGLANRVSLDRALTEAIEASGGRAGLCVIMGDLDNFKAVNDTFGHPVGDQVLVETAAVLRAATRAGDLVGRWGGEEFLVILQGTDEAEGRRLAERLRAAVSGHVYPSVEHLTASFGVAVHTPGEGRNVVVARADRALYRAKESGRDRVC